MKSIKMEYAVDWKGLAKDLGEVLQYDNEIEPKAEAVINEVKHLISLNGIEELWSLELIALYLYILTNENEDYRINLENYKISLEEIKEIYDYKYENKIEDDIKEYIK